MLYEVRFKLDADQGTSVLAVLKGLDGDKAVVGFVGGLDLPQVVMAIGRKLQKDALKWREDRPWGG